MSNLPALPDEDVVGDAWLAAQLRDPSKLGYPPMLPVELALRMGTPAEICKAYNIGKSEFEAIARHPVFIKAYQEAVEALKKDGMSFKMKAQMQAEDYLTTAYAMVKNANISDAVRADLIKATVRWAGLEPKNGGEAGGSNQFMININLG